MLLELSMLSIAERRFSMVRLCLALAITAFFIMFYFSANTAKYSLPDNAFIGNSLAEK
jgi:hypothetical protein